MKYIQYDERIEHFISDYFKKHNRYPSFQTDINLKRNNEKTFSKGDVSFSPNGWFTFYNKHHGGGGQLGAIKMTLKFNDDKKIISVNTFRLQFLNDNDYNTFKMLLEPWQNNIITKRSETFDYDCKGKICVAKNPYKILYKFDKCKKL